MDDKFEKARQLLTHPNFRKLSPEQIQKAYKVLLASGLTKDDLASIIRGPKPKQDLTYLENLPYDAFVNLIVTGQIQGKDLISLCNSSPLINEKCNKTFNAEGKVIPQYLFYFLLKQLGINLNNITDYRNFYIKYLQNKPFLSFEKKLKILGNILYEFDYERLIPWDIHNLFYSINRRGNFNLIIITAGPFYKRSIPYYSFSKDVRSNYEYANDLLNTLQVMEHYFYRNLPENFIYDLDTFINMARTNLQNFLEKSNLNPNFKPDANLSNAQETFREALDNLLEELYDRVEEKSRKEINSRRIIKDTIQWNRSLWVTIGLDKMKELIVDDEERQKYETLLTGISKLSKEELNYLVDLHEKVVLGQLPVLTPLKFEELIKY